MIFHMCPRKKKPGRGEIELSRKEIQEGFDFLDSEGALFGADLNPTVIKKSGTTRSFLARRAPSRRTLHSIWNKIMRNSVSPRTFYHLLFPTFHGLSHKDNMLLFGKDRIIYDAQIARGDDTVGGLTLCFYTVPAKTHGIISFFKRKSLRIIYIEGISLREQSSGYASTLFRYYEDLFNRLGFNEFRLKASLSVGKYYWAKEGFDCWDRNLIEETKEKVRILCREKSLPVKETEIRRLNHMYDLALFRKDIMISTFRNKEGYYSLSRDEDHREEFTFPLGKAFLLSSDPWDGHKVIYTNTPRRTAFIYSDMYLGHKPGGGHAEGPRRLTKCLKQIRKNELQESLIFMEPYYPEMSFIEKVHHPDYIMGFEESVKEGKPFYMTRDCKISQETFQAALLAVGGVMAGVDAVMNERVENAFCAVRPPGHHAGREKAMGFCFFNNVALGAIYARKMYGVERIFILDWDVHHGNGTEEIFEEDPKTYFLSIHEHPTFCYPGTGRRMDRGKGEGLRYTKNIPLKPHSTDRDVIEVFRTEVIDTIRTFEPHLIFISAGFDGHIDDPLADLHFTELAYARMTEMVCDVAGEICQGRIVSVLEGGYNSSSLTASLLHHLKILQGRK